MAEDLTFRALVLRETATGESDKLLTLLAENMGKITVSCRGVRSIKSHRLATTQLFCFNEFTVTVKKDRYYLKEASLIENFYAIRENIEKLALAQYVSELTEEVCVEGEEANEILALALNTLFMLSESSRSIYHIKSCFELRLCCLIGFMPDLSVCRSCQSEEQLYFDIAEGTLICSQCALDENAKNVCFLEKGTLDAMRYLTSAPSKRIFSFIIDEDLYPSLSQVCENYLIYRLEKKFETLSFFHSLGL